MLKFQQRESQNDYTKETVTEVAGATGLSEPVASILCARGMDTPEAAKRFLHPGPAQFNDPFLLPDMKKSVARIEQAISADEHITVFCDYDADGTTGGCALYLYLSRVGASVDIRTPNRHKEGYGLSIGAVEQMHADGTRLIVTVDCGITNVHEVILAKSVGIDVVITDHHECGDVLPDTEYIINPKRPDSKYPCAFLAGCGVAFKLIHALSSLKDAMRYIDLVAIGTITDIVPLLGENRAITHLGIQKMRSHPSAGIAALANAAGINLSAISSFGVSFGLGPRINAAGRMDTASVAIDILKASKPSTDLDLNARMLCELNDKRRAQVDDIIRTAEAIIHANEYMKDNAIMIAQQDWNTGVIGIAAAKIAEKYIRPCVLFGGAGDDLVGSARSIQGINIYEALGEFSDRYEKFGGHAQAAGLTIKQGILDALRTDVCAYLAKQYDESVYVKKSIYDMALGVHQITRKLVDDITRLEPFGMCNEQPSVAVFDADMTATKFVGKGVKPHLKFTMQRDDAGIDAVRFFFKDSHSFASRRCDFLGEVSINDYNDMPQMIVRHTAMKFDKRLISSFIAANKSFMMQNFMDEVVALRKSNGARLDEDAFSSAVADELAESRFGLCIIASTPPALNRLLKIPIVENALEIGTLCFYDQKSYTADNCIAVRRASAHDRLCYVGASGQASLMDEALLRDYADYAAKFFLPREALLQIYQKVNTLAQKKPRTNAEMGDYLSITPERTAFALRVFTELELIRYNKSGRILALMSKDKKNLRQSVCYAGFEDMIAQT